VVRLEITHSSPTGSPRCAKSQTKHRPPVYGCRAYPLIQKTPKKQKLRPRAQIGYLVGYNSSNIFRIWVPDRKVIETGDATFDESKKYDPDDPRPALLERVEEPLQTIEFPGLELARRVESEDEESGKKAIPWQFFILYLEHYLPDCP
jgi:hypothetical protein